jgi:hypothetical protein
MNVRHPEERRDVRLVGLGRQGVPEEDQGVDLPRGDLGADLEVSPPGSGEDVSHFQASPGSMTVSDDEPRARR